MALAVTHIIVTIVILDLFRHYFFTKKKFPRYLLVIGGIAGLLPDIDIPITWLYRIIMNTTDTLHGAFTHSIAFPIILVTIGFVLYQQDNIKWSKIMYVVAAGWFFHLILDCLYGGYTTFLWPQQIATTFCPEWGVQKHAADIDAIILLAWLVHEEIHKKIKDYI